MANQEHLSLLSKSGSVSHKRDLWNIWREEHPDIQPDVSGADLSNGNFDDFNLSNMNLSEIECGSSSFRKADLSGADLMEAYLGIVDFSEANLSNAILCGADLSGSNFQGANFTGANLQGVIFNGPHVNGFETKNVDLRGVTLTGADLSETDLSGINFSGADLRNANLKGSNLEGSNLSECDLRGADLTGCYIYAVSAWNVQLEESKQKNLIITPENEPGITVDNLELAQFIYLLLNNQNIRQVIDTITSQVVLILGRFNGERKGTLEISRHELRTRNYSPVTFDFEELGSSDFRETVRTLANMARFVLIDLTNLEDVLNEIVKVVPLCRVPFQPILFLDNQQDTYNQFLDLRHNHRWVLPLFRYQGSSDLLVSFQEKIIQSIEEKREELKQRKLLQVFFCYAQEDAGIFARLQKHLSVLERSGQIAMWDEQKLSPGEEKEKETAKRFANAHIIILLVSPDFLYSNDCIAIQERAMERYEKGDAIVIPLILRPCSWQSTPLSKLQILPRDKKSLIRRNQDSILFEVTNEIADVVKELS